MKTITLRSSIKPAIKQNKLFKGTFFAFLGALIFVFANIYLDASTLKIIGIPLLIISFTLIALGLIPYKKICKLEVFPHEIIIEKDKLTITYSKAFAFSIPIKSIDKTNYVDSKTCYGILIHLKNDQIKIYNKNLAKNFLKKDTKTVFLPYFTQAKYRELLEYI